MSILSKAAVCVLAAAVVGGCGSAPYRSGKGNDHQIMYRPANLEEVEIIEPEPAPRREVVYVRDPSGRYQAVPACRVVPPAGYGVAPGQPGYGYGPATPCYIE